ncbi:VOC family protein [Polyangium mundeleinium]|uniref:Glyoxalase/bleomycin resistance/extradiol dioxygenase family protein n=1 Tax=Polyangium mundeleinium TaxID=2995306 RepID=A0ABT5ERY0_9BACT|nr:VOC family protein [Polyangium mundeleinium]MDC0744574.1 glyoxalase/bleomycin resistance/extradiol dioxygenase family protein [Polyangium mundeleinium]
MTTTRSRKLFVNIAVKDLKRSVEFFTKLGFTFNPHFTDETATCMIVSEEAYFMLLVESKFKEFTKRQICDTSTATEGLYCLSCESRDEVDQMVKTAVENGGSRAMPAMDLGFMYNGSFYDIDGHHWEVMWMDPAAVQK